MKKYSVIILLILNCVLFFVFKNNTVSYWWSTHVLIPINNYGRFFTKSYHFSVGDILYSLLILNLLFLLTMAIIRIRKRQSRNLWLMRFAKGLCLILLSFQLLWTSQIHNRFLYHYYGINKSIKIQDTEIKQLLDTTIVSLNTLCLNRLNTIDKDYYLQVCTFTYQKTDTLLPKYNNASIKYSLFSSLMNRMTVSGYYNPLSSEAQVNRHIPAIIYPFTICHEIAHQLGFAAEDDANFVSYVKCIHSDDINLKYSATLQLYRYTLNRMMKIDSIYARQSKEHLNYIVTKDIQDVDLYWKQFEGSTEKITDLFYNKFMQLFGQQKGLLSYSRMVDWVIVYNNKSAH